MQKLYAVLLTALVVSYVTGCTSEAEHVEEHADSYRPRRSYKQDPNSLNPADDPDSGIQWKADLSTAMTDAQAAGKPVLLNVSVRALGVFGGKFY